MTKRIDGLTAVHVDLAVNLGRALRCCWRTSFGNEAPLDLARRVLLTLWTRRGAGRRDYGFLQKSE